MAYTVAQLVNQYNSEDAVMISNALTSRKLGIINTGRYYVANKQLAHTFTNYKTLPTAGLRGIGDGVAFSTVQGSTVTKALDLLSANGAWDQAYVGKDFNKHWNTHFYLYVLALAELAEKAYVYGGATTFGVSSVATSSWHQNAKQNNNVKDFDISGVGAVGTSIFAVR